MRDFANAYLGPVLGFSNNMGVVYVVEQVGGVKYPIPRSVATGAVQQSTLYFTDSSCTAGNGPYASAAAVSPGTYFVSSSQVYRAGSSTATLTFNSSRHAVSGVCTASAIGSMLAVGAGSYPGAVNIFQAVGPLIFVYP